MNSFILVSFSICALVSCDVDIKGTDCSIPSNEKDIITGSDFEISDNATAWTIKITVEGGTVTATPLDNEENGERYIDLSAEKSEITIKVTDEFANFESNQMFHNSTESIDLIKTFQFTCFDDDGAATGEQSISVQITVTDLNTHEPEFSASEYTFKFPKNLMPGVDLTSLNQTEPIIVDDIDFTNQNITFTLEPKDNPYGFIVDSRPYGSGNRAFQALLSVSESVTITEPINLTITATDGGDPNPLTSSATIIISAPSTFGDCTIEDHGLMDYGFMLVTIPDNDTWSQDIAIVGDLQLTDPHKEDDTAETYISIVLDDDKLTFSTNDNFTEIFEDDQKTQLRQPTLTIYKSFKLTCGEVEKGVTLGVMVEDTNNHYPNFTKDSYEYELPKQLMPQVDLTSLGDPILVEDLDFSNTEVTFTVDSPFVMDTVYYETFENRRLYRGLLRVSSYFTLEDDTTLTITATDNGNPPLSASTEVSIKITE